MSLEIRVVDVRDATALRAWWEVGRLATAERPGDPWPGWEVSRTALVAPNPERDLTFLAAVRDGATVGAALAMAYTRENTHAVGLDVHVVPAHRRRGVGSALLADVEARARALGRRTVLAEVFVPPGTSGPGEGFARARGYAVANRESLKTLDVSDYLERRDDLVSGIGTAADGYRVVTFDTVCPQEHLASFGRLLGTTLAEIPLGDLDLTDSDWTPQRLRAIEQRWVETDRHVLTAMAIGPDGAVAGSSDVRVDGADSSHGSVGLTLVDPAHRGHRLGLALKVATHDLAIAAYPDCASVRTSNAEANTHMNAVNEALGYRTSETLLEVQRRL